MSVRSFKLNAKDATGEPGGAAALDGSTHLKIQALDWML